MRCWRRGRDRLLDKGYMVPAAQCDAEKLPFPDDWFDCVTVAFGLRNMTHKDVALAEMHRVLQPGRPPAGAGVLAGMEAAGTGLRFLFVQGDPAGRQAGHG